MEPKKTGLILVLVLGAALFAVRRGGALVDGYIKEGDKKIACEWLSDRLLKADPATLTKSTAKRYAEVVTFIDAECWAKNRVSGPRA